MVSPDWQLTVLVICEAELDVRVRQVSRGALEIAVPSGNLTEPTSILPEPFLLTRPASLPAICDCAMFAPPVMFSSDRCPFSASYKVSKLALTYEANTGWPAMNVWLFLAWTA